MDIIAGSSLGLTMKALLLTKEREMNFEKIYYCAESIKGIDKKQEYSCGILYERRFYHIWNGRFFAAYKQGFIFIKG